MTDDNLIDIESPSMRGMGFAVRCGEKEIPIRMNAAGSSLWVCLIYRYQLVHFICSLVAVGLKHKICTISTEILLRIANIKYRSLNHKFFVISGISFKYLFLKYNSNLELNKIIRKSAKSRDFSIKSILHNNNQAIFFRHSFMA